MGCDDDLAEFAVRHAVLLTELAHLDPAGPAQVSLQRAGLVVEPRVHHAAVVAGLVNTDLRFLVEHLDQSAGTGLQQPARDGQTHDAGADHGDTVKTHTAGQPPPMLMDWRATHWPLSYGMYPTFEPTQGVSTV